jgi:sporulation protein YlmC with PRC-barrel domain
MFKKQTMLVLIGTALLTLPAAAQTGSGSSQPSASGAGGAQSGGAVQFITQAQPGQWRASKLIGIDVYGANNEKIGDIREILLDKSGMAQVVVLGVGGFLGIGEKNVAVPYNALQWSDQPVRTSSSSSSSSSNTTGTGATASTTTGRGLDYPDHAMLTGMTRDQLKNAPDFKYASDTSRSSGSSNTGPSGSGSGSGSAPR